MEDLSASHYAPPPSSLYYPPPSFYSPPPPIPGVSHPPPHHHHQPPPPHHYQPPPPHHYQLPPSQHYQPPPPQYYQPPPPHHYQPPPSLPPPSYNPQLPPPQPHYSLPQSEDEVRTLFIAGLPDDVKVREIHNLFREFPGFQSAQLRSSNGSSRAFAFAVFADQQSADSAMQALNGLVFDLEKDLTLHIDFAKSNSKSKRSRTDHGAPNSPDKKFRSGIAYSRGFHDSGAGSNIHMPGMGNPAYSINGYPSTQSHIVNNYATTDPNMPNNNPCSTLFVANLGLSCSEQELTDAFSRCPGFLNLKMQKKNGLPVAFVDFKDVTCSTGALKHLQGTCLRSSGGQGMRLEYAKSRMGKPAREKRK